MVYWAGACYRRFGVDSVTTGGIGRDRRHTVDGLWLRHHNGSVGRIGRSPRVTSRQVV